MHLRPVWAEVDVGAIRRNAERLRDRAAPAELCAVVKAQAYGHGPVRAAEAALAGGATWLAVALVEEGVALRDAGITEPVLVLSEPPPAAWAMVVRHGLTPALYTATAIETAAKAVAEHGAEPLSVHVKVDTGMHRVGASPAEAIDLAVAVDARPELALDGVWTHFAVADEPGNPFVGEQLARFNAVLAGLEVRGVSPRLRHAANSAATLTRPDARFDLVRCGIALYGLEPAPGVSGGVELEPAMSVKAAVALVKEVAAGERLSYGLRYECAEATVIATVPIGYADGVPRRLGATGGEVLIGGRRRAIAGTVTMDQLLVDCGPPGAGAPVQRGDEVVLIGRQGDERIGAWEWGRRVDTIAYEVVCGISSRVPRIWRS